MQTSERLYGNLRSVSDTQFSTPPALHHCDGRISDDLRLKRRRADHINVVAQREPAGDHLPQRPAILVLHPAVRADERQHAILAQEAQRLLDERHVEIRAVIERSESPAILSHQRRGDHLLPDVGRISHHKIKPGLQRLQEEVTIHQPRIRQLRRLTAGEAEFHQQRQDTLPQRREGITMQFHRPDRVPQFPRTHRIAPRRRQQPPNRRQKKISRAARRLQQPQLPQRLVRSVARQIQHEVHHLPPRVNRPALRPARRFHTLHLPTEENLRREKFRHGRGSVRHAASLERQPQATNGILSPRVHNSSILAFGGGGNNPAAWRATTR